MSIKLAQNERIDDIGRGMKLIQSSSTPCFSIDAVLLADFAAASSAKQVVDLGTGTGILPLLLSRRLKSAMFQGVELQSIMCDQAKRSVELNGLAERISIVQGDIRDIETACPRESADLLVSNPPYYRLGHGRCNNDPLFASARQEVNCCLADVVAAGAKVLKSSGRFCLVLRAGRIGELIALLANKGFACSRIRQIQPYADKCANLALVEAIKGGRNDLFMLPPLVIYESPGIYTKEIMEIYER